MYYGYSCLCTELPTILLCSLFLELSMSNAVLVGPRSLLPEWAEWAPVEETLWAWRRRVRGLANAGRIITNFNLISHFHTSHLIHSHHIHDTQPSHQPTHLPPNCGRIRITRTSNPGVIAKFFPINMHQDLGGLGSLVTVDVVFHNERLGIRLAG